MADLSERLTAAEEASWIALYRADPWGEQRGDMRSALITKFIHDTHSRKPKKLQDFMLFSDRPSERTSDSEVLRENFERLIERQKR